MSRGPRPRVEKGPWMPQVGSAGGVVEDANSHQQAERGGVPEQALELRLVLIAEVAVSQQPDRAVHAACEYAAANRQGAVDSVRVGSAKEKSDIFDDLSLGVIVDELWTELNGRVVEALENFTVGNPGNLNLFQRQVD